MPILQPEQLAAISELVAQYITTQRNRYVTMTVPLSIQQRAAMAGFFSSQLLDDASLVVLNEERVANPDFYPTLREFGFNNLPDQSSMAAITFFDTVVSHEPFTNGLLFHELVHVEQCRQLGVARFAALYVHGFLEGDGYFEIPLEQSTYTLSRLYEENLARNFVVADEVTRWIAESAPTST
jgi:hypothetical protein